MATVRSSRAQKRPKPHDSITKSPAPAAGDAAHTSARGTIPAVLADPERLARWLSALRSDARDLVAAALDATDTPGNRMLGRRAAREHVQEAARGLRDTFAAIGVPFDDDGPER